MVKPSRFKRTADDIDLTSPESHGRSLSLTPEADERDHAAFLLYITRELAAYLKTAFDELLLQCNPKLSDEEWQRKMIQERKYFLDPPDHIPREIAKEGWKMVTRLVQAYLKPLIIWDYDAEAVEGKIPPRPTNEPEDKHHIGYIGGSSGKKGYCDETLCQLPCVGVDPRGKILFWYLPDFWSAHTLNGAVHSMRKVSDLMNSNIESFTTLESSENNESWRTDEDYFAPDQDWEKLYLKPGVIDVSPAQFQEDHTSYPRKLAPSSSITDRTSGDRVLAYISELRQIKVLTNAVLSIVHPEQYEMQMKDAMTLLEMDITEFDHPEVSLEARRKWGSLWHGLHVASNRNSPLHRDYGTSCSWYDCLMTIGYCEDEGPVQLSLPHIACNFEYKNGTSMFFSGRLFLHGVTDTVGECERLAMIWYSKTEIQKVLADRYPPHPSPPAGYLRYLCPIDEELWVPATMHAISYHTSVMIQLFSQHRLHREFE